VSRSIAIIGASTDPAKYGNKAVRAWKNAGWTVYPVNPNEDQIEGLQAYASILDVPADVHTASLYLPPKIGLTVADEIIEKGVQEVYLNPGADSPELKQKLQDAGIEVIEACSIMAARTAS